MGWAVFPPCSLAWCQTMVGIMVVMVTCFKKTYASMLDCCIQCPWPHGMPLSIHTSTRDSWTLTGKSGSLSCGVTTPFTWLLMHTRTFCALQESVSTFCLVGASPLPLDMGIIFWWDPTFFCLWLFNGYLQFWSSHRRRWAHVLLLHHLSLLYIFIH